MRLNLPEPISELMAVQAAGLRTSPVLAVEGPGGSGKSESLRKALEKWRRETPTALVRPSEAVDSAENAVLGVLTAVMIDLSPGIRGYPVQFHRTLIAHLAIREDFSKLTATDALNRLKQVLLDHRDPAVLLAFVQSVVRAAGGLAAAIAGPPVAAAAPPVVDQVAAAVVASVRKWRWRRQIDWAGPVAWFGHQDMGFDFNPLQTLIDLSDWARSERPSRREEADHLLVAALLADLRRSRAAAGGDAPAILVLVDDGDLPAPSAFTSSLIHARGRLAAARTDLPPDPLNLVVATTGPVAEALATATGCGGESGWPGPWVRIPAGDLGPDEVRHLAESFRWGNGHRHGPVAHRLTRGHPEGTAVVLDELAKDSEPGTDVDSLLRRPAPGGTTVERRLLEPFVRGLNARKHVEEPLLEALVTLSAARDRLEAERLLPLLPHPVRHDSPVFTSRTLWSPAGADDGRLHPLARYLGLRALAAREDPATGWTAAFRKLRDRAGDRAGRLHHERLLSGKEGVAAELAALLPELPPGEWLALLEAVVATPDPRERDLAGVRGPKQPSTAADHVVVLLGVLPALDHDPCFTDEHALEELRELAKDSLRHLAEHARERGPFLLRAKSY